MKKKSMIVVFALSLVAALSFGIFAGCGDGKPLIAVVAKGESHAFWKAVRSGAEKAGEEKGYRVTFVGPQGEDAKYVNDQKSQVTSALNAKPKAMVLATIGTGFVDELTRAKDASIPVVQFDSGVWADDIKALNDANKNPIVSSVATSNTAAASLAAEKLYENLSTEIASASSYRIGVIQHDQTATGYDRAGGFVNGMIGKLKAADITFEVTGTSAQHNITAGSTSGGKVKIEVLISSTGDTAGSYTTLLEQLVTSGKPNAIFMTNEGVVKQVYDAIGAASANKYDDIKFCGFDAGTKQIDWIKDANGSYEKTPLIGSVAQNSIDIGYQSVLQAINAAEGKTITESVAISGAWYNKDNITQMIQDNLVYEG